jgi:hypothetical protein
MIGSNGSLRAESMNGSNQNKANVGHRSAQQHNQYDVRRTGAEADGDGDEWRRDDVQLQQLRRNGRLE